MVHPAAVPAVIVLVLFGTALSVIDARTHRLPNRLVAAFAVSALGTLLLAAGVLGDWDRLLRALLAGSACLVALGTSALLHSGLGMGDAKLGGIVGAYLGWVGWTALAAGLLAAFTLSALWALGRIAARRGTLATPIAFGPFMIAGIPLGVLLAAGTG